MALEKNQPKTGQRVDESPLFLVHYDEVGTKGKNRALFEQLLEESIRFALKGMGEHTVERMPGRLLVHFSAPLEADETAEVLRRLARVMGIANFSAAVRLPTDLAVIEHRILEDLREREYGSFRISARRCYKSLPFSSEDAARRLGAAVVDAFHKKVDLDHAELTVYVELMGRESFLYYEKLRGIGGLPLDPWNKVVVMISGGIDSPVAAFRVMKRGCFPVFVHFHSAPYTSELSIQKVRQLIGRLCEDRCRAALYLVPFAAIQRRMVSLCQAPFRILLYRRLMLRIAEEVAEREKALALVTGESLGQVASQTLRNQKAIEAVVRLPVLRPLIGMDKQEIIDQARNIGTYDLSIEPQGDCCSYLMPPNPATHSTVEELDQQESNMPIFEWVQEAIGSAEREELVRGIPQEDTGAGVG